MKKSFELVKSIYKSIQPLGCVAHGLHLLCSDILKISSVHEFLKKNSNIVHVIKRSQLLSSVFKKYQISKGIKIQLKLPVKTRWGSFLFCLESLFQNKSVLQAMAVDENLPTSLIRPIKLTLLDDNKYWENVSKMISLLTPIVDAIISIESNNNQIHLFRTLVNDVENQIELFFSKSMLNPLFSIAEEIKIVADIKKKKLFILGTVHLAAELLDPKTQGCKLNSNERIYTLEFIYELGISMGVNIMEDLSNYQSKTDKFAKKFIWENSLLSEPLKWWQFLNHISPLSKVAVRILSAPCTSAATERTFSTFSWIHNKKRNKLTTVRAGKLTYLSYNWKLKNKMCSISKKNEESSENSSVVIEEIQSSSNDIAPMNTEQSSSSQSDSDSDQSIIYDDTGSDEELISSSDEED
ncbi:unnamed protein product [Macrosiphum euphorbiae]|uniref:HAT C-terminal dimerisation domain-containing protein n=1 Tax=Macrosiphum euphorbiae TaxID=13131 RepID=A0AAV0W1N9_9HEMI|nr:unnamed protein product [Macrosiphum euphorbiae]